MCHLMKTGRYYYYADYSDVNRLIEDAFTAYVEVTKKHPNRAHVNPILFDKETTLTISGHAVKIVPDKMIAHHIVWMGEGVDE